MAIQLAADQVLKNILEDFSQNSAREELPNRVEDWIKTYKEPALQFDNRKLSRIFIDLQALKRGLARAHATIGINHQRGTKEFDQMDALDEMIELEQSRIFGAEHFPVRLVVEQEDSPHLQEAIAAQKKIRECAEQIFQFEKYVATRKKNTIRRNCVIL